MDLLQIIIFELEDYDYDVISHQENSSWIVVQIDTRSSDINKILDIVDTALFETTGKFFHISARPTGDGIELEVYKN